MRRLFSLRTLLVAATLIFTLAQVSRADTVSIGWDTGGSITTAATSNSGVTSVTNAAFGAVFTANNVSVIGTPPLTEPNVQTNSINVASSGAGTLHVWITEQGLTSPAALVNFLSSFTLNTLQGAITSVTENTYLDTGNGLWATTTPLGSHSFSDLGAATANQSVDLSGVTSLLPYSITAEYTIVTTGAGSANGTINLSGSVVPEPASMLLLGTGLVGIGGFIRRFRK